ncbi:MAG: c-type cytochrome [Planctomycetes bacterium]|nr:c-type cytochrome [Planctomycetota bacterium]MCB9868256.1 c-type cytochrome [Planctomycetota bacterium]MCB9888768.1 c-type cytochrome [Planctomycetota bacterium]
MPRILDLVWFVLLVSPVLAQSDAAIKLPAGFRAKQVYSVGKGQGSWVCLTVDERGRLIASDQRGGLYRVTLDSDKAQVERLRTTVGGAQGLLCAFGSLYVMGRDGKRSGLFRLTDTDHDDQPDRVELLFEVPVGPEHGGHAVVLAPDGKSLYVCCGNQTGVPKPGFTGSRVPRVEAGDHLVPRMPDAGGHNTGAPPLGGWVAQVAPDGSSRVLVASGFRNHYALAFDRDGELFTYDSDMEWDIGTPWYRPTRICHVVSGAEFGWRYGTGKWPTCNPDSLPPVHDVGPGSPTGVLFGTGARFPERYQRALFAADWSYGVIYAVHLEPQGASFTATKEAFATAVPFAVTAAVVRPQDGALYVTTGGRGTRSGLYRIAYTGDEKSTALPPTPRARADLRELRQQIEEMHHPGASGAVSMAWRYLGHADRHIRFAARIAIEHQPVATWRPRVLAEKDPRTLMHAAIALARHGNADDRAPLFARLLELDFRALERDRKLEWLRAVGLVSVRLGAPDQTGRGKLIGELLRAFPATDPQLDRELCRLLAHLDADGLVAKALAAQRAATTQEQQMHVAYCLRVVNAGWTLDHRREYFAWFDRAAELRGGSSFRGFCRNIRADAIARLPAADRTALAAVLAREPARAEVRSAPARPFVRNWSVAELVPELTGKRNGHDFARGQRLYGEALCARCHRFAGEGGAVGPDLTALGRRFGVREILEAIIEPSKVISDQYQPTVFELKDGEFVIGYVANLNGDRLKIAQNMLEPGKLTDVRVGQIKSRRPSTVSMMPPGLLSTLTLAEVQDLVAYLRSGGARDHALFGKPDPRKVR